jgi:hypothetical protein
MSLLQRKGQCRICKLILQSLENHWRKPTFESIALDTVGKALSSDCKIHRALLLIVFPDLSLNERTPRFAHALNKTLYLEKHWHGLFHFSVVNIPFEKAGSSLTRVLSKPLALSKKNRIAAYRGSGRIVDPKWIDIRLLRTWKTTCEVQHGDSCKLIHNHSNISQHHPSLLVDTWRMCLTKNLSVKSYVALSYVWGPVPTLKTIQANLEAFQQTGSLRREEVASKLPRTIRDAIALTELLQERYLWVDSLCIVQDDETSSHDQITKMASIYANAALTIVAAGGEDANYGLRGIRGISQPRSHSQQIGQLPHGVQIIERHFASYENSTWSERSVGYPTLFGIILKALDGYSTLNLYSARIPRIKGVTRVEYRYTTCNI